MIQWQLGGGSPSPPLALHGEGVKTPKVTGQEPAFYKGKVPGAAPRVSAKQQTLPSGRSSRGLGIHTI